MKGRNKQTLSITPRTDAHTAPNRALRPDARPGKHLLTPPCLTLINIHITTLYVSVCRMRSEGRCASFHYKKQSDYEKDSFSRSRRTPVAREQANPQ